MSNRVLRLPIYEEDAEWVQNQRQPINRHQQGKRLKESLAETFHRLRAELEAYRQASSRSDPLV